MAIIRAGQYVYKEDITLPSETIEQSINIKHDGANEYGGEFLMVVDRVKITTKYLYLNVTTLEPSDFKGAPPFNSNFPHEAYIYDGDYNQWAYDYYIKTRNFTVLKDTNVSDEFNVWFTQNVLTLSIAEKLQTIAENEQRVFDAGKADKLREMWSARLQNGARTDYSFAFFSDNISKENFKPTHDIKPVGEGSAVDMFFRFNIQCQESLKMSEVEQECGIVFDFSSTSGSMQRTFCNSAFTELNVIDVSNASLYITFYGGYGEWGRLTRINRLICSERTVFNTLVFDYNNKLEYVGFEGVIAQNGVDLSTCPNVNKDTHINLINTLSAGTLGLSVSLCLAAVNRAFETSEGANDGSTSSEWLNLIASKNNWTINLV